MNERLLQFIWQFQYFNRSGLFTTAAEPVQIISSGKYNIHQGPDFSEARIRIGPATWAGTVELHVFASDWKKHGHHSDENYKNVILHVVWEDDTGDRAIPTLELKSRIPGLLLDRYATLLQTGTFIACEKLIGRVKEITWCSWKDRLVAERLTRKAGEVLQMLKDNQVHWEETFWRLLARYFGASVNASAFEEMAQTLPVSLLSRHRSQIHQLEALLMGQAGLLQAESEDPYYILLQREYRFLRLKYKLEPICQPVHFLRMRPRNFPTVRLAQLAALLQKSGPLFSTVRDLESISELREWFNVTANDYWHYHYRFGEPSSYRKKNTGLRLLDRIIINCLAPVLFAYGDYYRDLKFRDRAMRWLETTGPERNSYTAGFEKLGVKNISALDSQALIELKRNYCEKKMCLECGIGNEVLKG
ncbi:MAG: DUF2851 family protein [Chitinophagaceae bacterium]